MGFLGSCNCGCAGAGWAVWEVYFYHEYYGFAGRFDPELCGGDYGAAIHPTPLYLRRIDTYDIQYSSGHHTTVTTQDIDQYIGTLTQNFVTTPGSAFQDTPNYDHTDSTINANTNLVFEDVQNFYLADNTLIYSITRRIELHVEHPYDAWLAECAALYAHVTLGELQAALAAEIKAAGPPGVGDCYVHTWQVWYTGPGTFNAPELGSIMLDVDAVAAGGYAEASRQNTFYVASYEANSSGAPYYHDPSIGYVAAANYLGHKSVWYNLQNIRVQQATPVVCQSNATTLGSETDPFNVDEYVGFESALGAAQNVYITRFGP